MLTSPEDKMNNKLFNLRKKQLDYKVRRRTSSCLIKYPGKDDKEEKRFYRLYKKQYKVPIQTICADVRRDCRAWLRKMRGKLDETGNYNGPHPEFMELFKQKQFFILPDLDEYARNSGGISTQEYDRIAINRDLEVGQFLHEPDCNACYWTLMYTLGFITYATYKKYLKFKEERNIAIGALNSSYTDEEYKKGKKVAEVRQYSKYSPFRQMVVIKMHSIYSELAAELHKHGKTIYYFKTDAFLLHPGPQMQNKVKQVLDKHGLAYKTNRWKIIELWGSHMRLQSMDQKDPDTKKLKEKVLNF